MSVRLQQVVKYTVAEIHDVLWATPTFEEYFHSQRHDTDVVVSDWLSANDGTKHRVCFFVMSDAPSSDESSNTNKIKCMETQRLHWDHSASPYSLVLNASIVPENANIGSPFRLQTQFTVTENVDKCESLLEISITIESRVTGMLMKSVVDRILQSKIKQLYEQWISLAEDYLNQHALIATRDASPTVPDTVQTNRQKRSGERKERSRAKPQKRYPKLVHQFNLSSTRGTEHVVRMLQSIGTSHTRKYHNTEVENVRSSDHSTIQPTVMMDTPPHTQITQVDKKETLDKHPSKTAEDIVITMPSKRSKKAPVTSRIIPLSCFVIFCVCLLVILLQVRLFY